MRHTNHASWEISTFFLSYSRLPLMSKTVWWAVSSGESRIYSLWGFIQNLPKSGRESGPASVGHEKRVFPQTRFNVGHRFMSAVRFISHQENTAASEAPVRTGRKTRYMAMILDSILTEAKQIMQCQTRSTNPVYRHLKPTVWSALLLLSCTEA